METKAGQKVYLKVPKQQSKKIGRPSTYTEEMATTICERIADGESLRKICNEPDMPPKKTVLAWLKVHEDFRTQYAQARDEQADALFDETLHIADTEEDWQRARLRIDTRKWVAGKLRPKKYGDKVDVEHTGGLTVVFDSKDKGLL